MIENATYGLFTLRAQSYERFQHGTEVNRPQQKKKKKKFMEIRA